MPLLVSIVLDMQSKEGHFYSYHEAVGRAARLIGWQHQVAVTTNWRPAELPPGWVPCLRRQGFQRAEKPVAKIRNVLALGDSIAHYVRQRVAAQPDTPVIVFLEHFYPAFLLALIFALLQVERRNLSVWLLYRMKLQAKGVWGPVYKLLNATIERIIYPNKLILMTDGDLLSASLSQYFGQPVYVVPVLPYIDAPDDNAIPVQASLSACADRLVCWWPGPPRSEKGLAILRSMTSLTTPEASQVCVVAAENAQLVQHAGGCQVIPIGKSIGRAEYLGWFAASDVILLPYDAIAYAEKTSGIFTESILFAKIPVVTEGTWMAHELRKYGLDELILSSWNQPAVLADILRIARDTSVRSKLKPMQQHYRQLNGEQAYAEALQTIL